MYDIVRPAYGVQYSNIISLLGLIWGLPRIARPLGTSPLSCWIFCCWYTGGGPQTFRPHFSATARVHCWWVLSSASTC